MKVEKQGTIQMISLGLKVCVYICGLHAALLTHVGAVRNI